MEKYTKQLWVLAIAFATSVALGQQVKEASKAEVAQRPAAQARTLTRAELDKLLARPEQLLIIDVRRPDELTSIGGFPVYLSIQLAELEKSLAWIPQDRTIVTVSNHAGRAGRAADLLAGKGFKVAGAIGAQNYEEQGGKLTRVAPRTKANVRAAVKPAT